MSYKADREQDMFCDWLEAEYPELGNFSQQTWQRYLTYDPPLIVEYWTYLNSYWEMRLAVHVTWEQDKWTKFWLRPRGEWDPAMAAIHDTDDTWYEMPTSDFPFLFGY
jgi:hypothetical protein